MASHMEDCMNEIEPNANVDSGQTARPNPGSALRERPPGKEFQYEAPAGNGMSPLQVGAGMVIL